MRILFVTPYVPSAVRVRPFAFIRQLARLGHQVTLVCLVQPAWEEKYLSEAAPYCTQIYPVHIQRREAVLNALSTLPTPAPLSVGYCRSAQLQRVIHQVYHREKFDLVHTEFVRAAQFTARLDGLPKVFDAVDSTALAYRRSMQAPNVPLKQRVIAAAEWVKLRTYEPRAASHFDRVLVSSPVDQGELKQRCPHVEVIPNGVDTTYFDYYDGPRDSANIVFLGKMSYYVNIASVLWFYEKVFSVVRAVHPEVTFSIVGREPADAIRALAADPMVEVTGTVPDVRPYLAKATLAVCPMVSGAGIQNKMLEAMSTGAPCVATSLAVQALGVQKGDVMVANDPNEFASHIVSLLEQPERRCQMAEAGRRYVEQCHGWSKIGQQLNQIYVDLVAGKQRMSSPKLEMGGKS